jgi:hypothetical protein
MEKITIDNYEAYLLDYLEGRLSEEMARELNIFAVTHPELQINLDENDLAYVEPAAIEGFDKQGLLRSEDDLLLNNSTLNYIEGQLAGPDKQDFEKKLRADKQLQSEVNIFYKTRLQPDLTVVFPGKRDLRKSGKIIALFNPRAVARMAAAIFLLAGLTLIYKYFRTEEPHTKFKVNVRENKSVPVPVIETMPDNQIAAKEKSQDKIKQSRSVDPPASWSRMNTGTENKKTEPDDSESPQPLLAAEVLKEKETAPTNIETELTTPAEAFETPQPVSKTTIAIVEETDDYEVMAEESHKGSFWKRVVRLARHANSLGVASIDGHETGRNKFTVSFNSFSVEKK